MRTPVFHCVALRHLCPVQPQSLRKLHLAEKIVQKLCAGHTQPESQGAQKNCAKIVLEPHFLRRNCAKVVRAQFSRNFGERCLGGPESASAQVLRIFLESPAVRAINVSSVAAPRDCNLSLMKCSPPTTPETPSSSKVTKTWLSGCPPPTVALKVTRKVSFLTRKKKVTFEALFGSKATFLVILFGLYFLFFFLGGGGESHAF